MTRDDYDKLDASSLYEFKLYNGIVKYGYINENFKSHKFFIVNPNKPSVEFEVKLQQIIAWPVLLKKNVEESASIFLPSSRKSKKAIILGAGASYDFTHAQAINDDYRMPLTKDLFHDRYLKIMEKYPGAYDLSSEILLATDIESYFQNQWKKIERTHDQSLLTKVINTQYYIHDLFLSLSRQFANNRKSNYFNLIKLAHEYTNEEENEFFPIISFNYDTLIEEAITRNQQLQFENIRDYVDFKNRKLLLFKPHGSANWVKSFNMKFMDINFIRNLSHVSFLSSAIYSMNHSLSHIYDHLESNIKIISNNVNLNENKIQNYYFPWLLIPYKDKDSFMMPSEHETILEHFLPEIDEFLIIGWKGTEDKFKKLLTENLKNKKVKITLIDIDHNAAERFKAVYSIALPLSEINHFNDETMKQGASFSDYITHCQNSDKHFFTRNTN